MEKHCVSLELAKQLKETGWKKETEFEWGQHRNGKWAIEPHSFISALKDSDDISPITYPAPFATEILEELPREYESWITIIRTKPDNGYKLLHRDIEAKIGLNFDGDNLPNALAKMLLYLQKE